MPEEKSSVPDTRWVYAFRQAVLANIEEASFQVLGRYVDGFMESDNIIYIIENGSLGDRQLRMKGIYYPPC